MKRSLLILLWGFLAPALASDAPRFDYYVLSLSWTPAFCEDNPQAKRRLAQCRTLASRDAPLLGLHGLWPNRRDGRHPQDCAGRTESFCRLPPLRLPATVAVRLDRVMPAAQDCLDRHEWFKHGSCTGLSEADYFTAAAQWAERVAADLDGTLRQNAGRPVALDDLVAVVAQKDRPLAEALLFDCRTPRTPDPAKRKPMLQEVRVFLSRDPASGAPGGPLPRRAVGVPSYNSGCPAGRAYVDSPLD
jgi:ribonuclease T2